MIRIGTIIFTYHRSEHTKKVLEALSGNDLLPEKLYIFQDGITKGTDCDGWRKVNGLIKSINWCDSEVYVSEKHIGLAESVTAGINYVLNECDAVIVLEDDCVPYKQFMRFMVSALNTYENEKMVYSVSGYAWNVDLPYSEYDAYFNGKCCSWGWGTWKDRWCQYEEDYHILARIKSNPAANRRLNIWSKNMESVLIGNVEGRCDSWAVFWGLKIIEKGGYCLSPYKQLVHNIGFDGSGVHCAIQQDYHLISVMEYKESFKFPQNIESTKECESQFRFLYGKGTYTEKMQAYFELLVRWVQLKQTGKTIRMPIRYGEQIAVFGRGKLFDCLLQEIRDSVEIKYIIESRPTIKEYQGIPIISIGKIPDDIRDVIVIPYYDMEIILKELERIRPGINLIGINELFD